MKIYRLLLIAGTVTVLFAAGFFVGGMYASNRAVRADNQASLIFFSLIHASLERQDYTGAASMTNVAVDAHVGVLNELDTAPWQIRAVHVFPWTQKEESAFTIDSFSSVRRAYGPQIEQLRVETRNFLAAQPFRASTCTIDRPAASEVRSP